MIHELLVLNHDLFIIIGDVYQFIKHCLIAGIFCFLRGDRQTSLYFYRCPVHTKQPLDNSQKLEVKIQSRINLSGGHFYRGDFF